MEPQLASALPLLPPLAPSPISQIKAELYDGNAIVLFAYGLSGSGKTFTVFGMDAVDNPISWFHQPTPHDMWGLFPALAYELFQDKQVCARACACVRVCVCACVRACVRERAGGRVDRPRWRPMDYPKHATNFSKSVQYA